MADVEKVKLPAIGQVDKKLVYLAGAGIAGFAGYAWWSKGGMEPDVAPTLIPAPVTDYEPPTVLNSNGSFGPAPAGPVAGMPVSNVEWQTMAREQAAAFRWDESLVNSALQNYLARQPMTAAEVAVVSSIVAVIGVPPQNGPFSLIPKLGPTTPPPPHEGDKLAAPPGFNPQPASPNTVWLQWNRVAGAISYEVRADNSGAWSNVGAVERIEVPAPAGTHTYHVRAVDGSGKPGNEASGSVKTSTQAEFNQALYNYAHK